MDTFLFFTPKRPSSVQAYALLTVTTKEKRIDKKAWQRLAEQQSCYIALGTQSEEVLLSEASRRAAIDPKSVFVFAEKEGVILPEEAWTGRVVRAIKPVLTTLSVEMKGLRPRNKNNSKNGILQAILFDNGTGFPGESKSAKYQSLTLPAETPQSSTLKFEKLAPGFYAVVILHDENEDGKMNTSFKIPTEGYGSSNNPTAYRPPRFDECRFLLTGASETRQIEIKMNYF
jgi:uncharacterized protein (DUF2141 family)